MTSPPDDEQDESPEAIRHEEEEAAGRENLFYGSVAEFVTDRFSYLVTPPSRDSGRVWCPEWYRHPQALARLDSVWRAWEMLRFDAGLGMSNWWVHHADPHWRALTDPVTGPFARCADGHHGFGMEQLPLVEPPDGLFPDQRLSPSQDALPLFRDPLALD